MSKILFSGNDREMISSFFAASKEGDVFLSSSAHPDDIMNHTKLFSPDAFVICADKETGEQLMQYKVALDSFSEKNIPCAVIGSDEDLDAAFSYLGDEKVKKNIDRELQFQSILDTVNIMIMDSKNSPSQAEPEPEEEAEEMSPYIVPEETPQQESHEAEYDPTRPPPESAKAKKNENFAAKKKVLIVDDDPVMLKTIKLYLEEEYTVLTALKGSLALNYFKQKTADLILLDYEMPEMSGLQVLMELRKSIRTNTIPVIFLTGMSDVDKIKELGKLKIQGYILKPVNREKLCETIRKVVGTKDDLLVTSAPEPAETRHVPDVKPRKIGNII